MAKFAIIQNFYASDKWRKFRMMLIAERGNRCEKCKELILQSIYIHGHHKIELTPENVNDHNISLNPDNVELLCFDCHNKEHNRFGHRTEKKVYLVFGPPQGGKTSFVKQHMQRGDLIVDMDKLYAAVTLLPEYDKPDALFSNVIGIHNLLIDNIKVRHGKWNTAWIIGGYADKHKRNRMADQLGAELVFCDVSKEECLARLETDEDLKYRKAEWAGYIDKWFSQYSE